MKYVVVEINFKGEKKVLEGLFNYDNACRLQEIMENLNKEKSYLIYTAEEWMAEG